ncbi:hypothetical protein WDU94_002547 [Cyamophila willieti]
MLAESGKYLKEHDYYEKCVQEREKEEKLLLKSSGGSSSSSSGCLCFQKPVATPQPPSPPSQHIMENSIVTAEGGLRAIVTSQPRCYVTVDSS